MTSSLPIDPILPRIVETLAHTQNAVVSAAPGTGKTTRIPPALLGADWLGGRKILMLEPRRIAVRRAAQFMSEERGEKPGDTIGFRIRGESQVSPATRIEIVTEGILTRMLQHDPDLPEVGVVIFDEFHERSIHADLGLALTLDAQENLRPDLRILVMSATLDGVAVAGMLGNAPVIDAPGRMFPVETRYLTFRNDGRIESRICDLVLRALPISRGDLLVFLPGQREIKATETMLRERRLGSEIEIHPLFGEAPHAQQQAALARATGDRRKIILSTSIAESSVTIDGVRVVIDSGLARTVRFDPRRGMSGLVTVPVSRATADQRRGRAGRQAPGLCFRAWTEPDHEKLAPYPVPEILATDLVPLALDLALWGAYEGAALKFLDPPPPAHIAHARGLLQSLGALDLRGSLTPHGRLMADLPVHPRIAHMILRGKSLGAGPMACMLAALLESRDLVRGQRTEDIDLYSRWLALHSGYAVDRGARDRILQDARRLAEGADVDQKQKPTVALPDVPRSGSSTLSPDQRLLSVLLAYAYPDRVARRREPESRRYQLSGGAGAALPEWSLLALEEFLAVADIDGVGTDPKIFLATPLLKNDLMEFFAEERVVRDETGWNEVEEAVVARRATMLGGLVIEEKSIRPEPAALVDGMIAGIRSMGLDALPWTRDLHSLVLRCEWIRARELGGPEWPDLSRPTLERTLAQWLAPFLSGIERKIALDRVDLSSALRSIFTYAQWQTIDELAPESMVTPTGHRVKLSYDGEIPVMPVKLQEMFGQVTTPSIGRGRVNILLHLLSPAGRPLAVTQDLPSFWKNAYPEVRKQMRGRYPKHPWPEDPLAAAPTRKTKQSEK